RGRGAGKATPPVKQMVAPQETDERSGNVFENKRPLCGCKLLCALRGPIPVEAFAMSGSLHGITVDGGGVFDGERTVRGVALNGEADFVASDRTLERSLSTSSSQRALDLAAVLGDRQGLGHRSVRSLGRHLPGPGSVCGFVSGPYRVRAD